MLRCLSLVSSAPLGFALACEAPPGPREGHVEVCIGEFFSIDPDPGEPYVVDDFIVREPERRVGCDTLGARLNVELVRASNSAEQMRIIVIERDADDRVVGEALDVPIGTQLRVFADKGRSNVDVEVALESDDGTLLFSVGSGRNLRGAHLDIAFADTVGEPFTFGGCGEYRQAAIRVFDGEQAITIRPGDTVAAAGFVAKNVNAHRVDVIEGACTDVRDGDFASWVIHRDE